MIAPFQTDASHVSTSEARRRATSGRNTLAPSSIRAALRGHYHRPITDTLNIFTIVVVAILAIRVVWISVREFLVWRQRRIAASAPRNQQLIWRGDFIGALIEMVGQDTRPNRPLRRLRKALGWTEGRARLVLDSLSAKGLVERVIWGASADEPFQTLGRLVGGVRVRLTEAGLDEAERAESGPTENLPHILAYRSIVTVAGRDAAVESPGAYGRDTAIGSPAAHGTGVAIQSPGASQTLIEHGLDPKLIQQWIDMYRRALHESTALSERTARHAGSLLDDLERAVDNGDATRVDSLGQTLRAIAEGAAASAVFAGIVAFAEHFSFGS